MNSKPWWQSRTLWFNALVVLATFLVDPSAQLETMGLPPETVVRIVAAANGILRIVSIGAVVFRSER